MKKTFKKNLAILAKNGIVATNTKPVWDDKPNSVELETYTSSGEDMFICLEEPTKECLQKYIDEFDINENVLVWWGDGVEEAHSKGVPFDNIKDHYEDYESYLENLKEICQQLS